MATRTARTDLGASSLSDGQSLEYRLKPKATATFAWLDDKGTTVLTHTDFPPMPDEIVWQLKAAAGGGLTLTVPQNVSYSRTGSPGDIDVYLLSLGFFGLAPGYTLTVKRLDNAGVPVQTITDVDYTNAVATDDPAKEPLAVTLT